MSTATATAETAETNPNILPFEVDGLFDDAVPVTSAEVDQMEVADGAVDPDDETVLSTPAEDEDDGPQPGDEIDDEPTAEIVQVEASEAAPAAGITMAENALVQIWNAERRCGIAKAAWNSAKEAAKDAKDEYDGCVDELRRLARAAELDADRPLLAAAEAVNAAEASRVQATEAATDADDDDGEMFDDDEIAKSMTSDAVNEHLRVRLQPGQIRIRLTREVVDDHPQRGKLTWPKGTEIVATVDSSGTTIIPFADDPTDGTGLEAEEFEVLEDGAFNVVTTPEPTSDDDARLDTLLAETSIPTAILAKLKDEAKIVTVRDLANWSSSGKLLTDIKGIGQGKADKIDAAMVEFWKGAK